MFVVPQSIDLSMNRLISLVLLKLSYAQVTQGQDCGRFFLKSTNFRTDFMIVGGHLAPVGLFPWIVSFQSQSQDEWTHYCAGTIISEEWVITAAHCVENQNATKLDRINAGSNLKAASTSIHKPVQAFVHSRIHGRNVSDIALIQVTPPFNFTEGIFGDGAILPICLPRVSEQFHGSVTIAGWGALKDKGKDQNLDYPDKLRFVHVDIINNDLCALHSNYFTEISYMCTTSIIPNQEEGACYGDSGGPLIGVSNGQAYLVGLVSGANSYPQLCASETNPTVYTKVSSFRLWIFLHTYV